MKKNIFIPRKIAKRQIPVMTLLVLSINLFSQPELLSINDFITENEPSTGSLTGHDTLLKIQSANGTSDEAYRTELKAHRQEPEDSLIAAGTYRLTDIDDNQYKVVRIGEQVWMAENLKTSRYNDSTAIPNITDAKWMELTTPSYCWYKNDAATFKALYGALYNWYAVDTISNGGKNVCPTGWHVSTDGDWNILTRYLINNGYGFNGSGDDIGKSMASVFGWEIDGTEGNAGNDQASNNTSGFAAYPAGYRLSNGTYGSLGFSCSWWSSTGFSSLNAYFRSIAYCYSYVKRGLFDKHSGFSVRCLRDL